MESQPGDRNTLVERGMGLSNGGHLGTGYCPTAGTSQFHALWFLSLWHLGAVFQASEPETGGNQERGM